MFGSPVAAEENNGPLDTVYTASLTLPSGAKPLVMVKIPAGTFMMGSPDSDSDAESDEKPQHSVTLTKDFYIGRYEVTQAQWEAVMGSNPSSFSGDNRPVEQVSWNDVQDFLSALNNGGYAPGGYEFALPTEAQWEYCVRAGTTTIYSYGNDSSSLGTYAWYNDNSGSTTHDVGGKSANPWGLYDMYGNVFEWCRDWYDSSYYGSNPSTDPVNTYSSTLRVLRGGSWYYNAAMHRSAGRGYGPPDSRDYNASGFRLALVPSSDDNASTPALVAHWTFDEGSGTTAADASGNGNTGTINGVTWISGVVGAGALKFSGSASSYVKVLDADDLDGFEDFTLAAWIRPDTLGSNNQHIISKYDSGNTYSYSLGYNNTSNEVINGGFSMTGSETGSGPQSVMGNTKPTVGEWVHVTMVKSGTTLTLYQNGVSDGVNNSVANSVFAGSADVYIGKLNANNLAAYAFSGSIDDVRIYNYVLSESEIAELYAMKDSADCPGGGTCYTAAEIEALKSAAYDEGYAAGLAVNADDTGTSGSEEPCDTSLEADYDGISGILTIPSVIAGRARYSVKMRYMKERENMGMFFELSEAQEK